MVDGVIAVLGEYTPDFPPHPATNAAIEHAAKRLGLDICSEWISTEEIDASLFQEHSGIWVAPGSPYKNMEKTLGAIHYAREHGVPCFGTCGGFQHIVLEFARNALGFADAQHAEYDPYASELFISELECSLAGREMELHLAPRSRTAEIYGTQYVKERYYCNFGVNPKYVPLLKTGALKVVGSDAEGALRVVELPHHPFFIGTLYVPQARSDEGQPHPLVTAFLKAVVKRQSLTPA